MIGTMAKLRRSMLVAVMVGAVLSVAAGLVGTSLECYLCAWWEWLLAALLASLLWALALAAVALAGWGLWVVAGVVARDPGRARVVVLAGAGGDAAAVGRTGCHGAVTD